MPGGVTYVTALLAVAAAALAGTPAHAQVSETSVKAAFLPRFARYVTWPPNAVPSATAPFVLCVIGSDPFGGSLDQAARSQSVVVRRMATAAQSGGCHVAFIGDGSSEAGQVLAAIGRRPVLTVTDARNGGQRGIIHFAVVSGRVRFFIDQAAAQQRGLTVSSRLLALAVGVRQ